MAFLDNLDETLVDVVDWVTALPGKVSRRSDGLNDKFISIARDLQAALRASGDVAQENLTENKIQSIGRNVADWLSDGNNFVIAMGGVVVTLILMLLIVRKI